MPTSPTVRTIGITAVYVVYVGGRETRTLSV
jgi:hypothetical protein